MIAVKGGLQPIAISVKIPLILAWTLITYEPGNPISLP